MIRKDELKDMARKVFEKYGLSEEISETIADVLVHANLRGVDSHGVLRVEHYIKRMKEGGINIAPDLKESNSSASTSTIDGDNGFGHYISKKAMESAIAKAKTEGIGAVAVKNSSHCGALSYFVSQATDENLIGVAMTHADKIVVPFGGSESFFGTNPIAFGFPADKEEPVILDFATSTVALGKVLNAKEQGKSIPSGWGVDEDGSDTNNPDEVAALTPFGGPKGYGLAMVVEIFTALLTGAAFGPHISKMYGDYDKNRELGHFFMVIDPDKFVAIDTFASRLDQMIKELREAPPAKNVERIYVPGEIEMMNVKERTVNGIPISDSIIGYLRKELNRE
ncbi:ureidoglycolate dehydrogenase [Salinicoccus sediminis]|uniref:Ureidoglycolate dehydrogenase n=1 Tax=Salinicoccus sediminis TaxID=1432562 RepID=A0A0M2SQU8_9STAP|nr:ureidoglycolate dehydrogenase [Salinicoccus sediminis]KKK34995.1 ureidoglycolate dehydrogenase [Salinicoccus sediminis]